MVKNIKSPPCSQEELRDIFEYTDDGQLWWNYPGKRRRVDTPAGSINKVSGYRRITFKSYPYYSHRLIYFWHTGEWPDVIDHINGDRADNRIENLRAVSQLANTHGARKPMKRSDDGLPGTTYSKRTERWIAQITVRGKYRYLGSYKTTEAAHAAYLAAKAELRQKLGIA